MTLAPEDDIADYVANKVGACLGEFFYLLDTFRLKYQEIDMTLFQLLNKIQRIHQYLAHHVTPKHFPQYLEKGGKSCQITRLVSKFFTTNQEMY